MSLCINEIHKKKFFWLYTILKAAVLRIEIVTLKKLLLPCWQRIDCMRCLKQENEKKYVQILQRYSNVIMEQSIKFLVILWNVTYILRR